MDRSGFDYVNKWLSECKIGLGTYQVRKEKEIYDILDAALSCGYRYVDTAQVYANEKFIGSALQTLLPKHGLKREDVFIVSKLEPANQGYAKCKSSVEQSLKHLQTGYIDLFLIHWPGCSGIKPEDNRNKVIRQQSWDCLEGLLQERKLRSIGVSNYNVSHLQDLLQTSKVSPALNQCEFHPHYYVSELVKFCEENKIHFQAYSSFGSESNKEDLLSDELVKATAKKYKTSVTNFLLAWSLSQGISVLPRSRNPEHVKANFEARHLKVTPDDIETVEREEIRKYCWNPDTVC